MALFIHPENQKILWNAISQSNLFQNLGDSRESWFRNAVEQFYKKISGININIELLQKINKDFIQDILKVLKNITLSQTNALPQFYQPSTTPQSTIQQPSTAQQSTIQPQSNYQYNSNSTYYNPEQNIYTNLSQSTHNTNQVTPNINQNISYTLDSNKSASRDYISEKKQDEINSKFTNRLNQYNDLIIKNIPSANFKESEMDKPISNMDELVKRHMMERDQVLQYEQQSQPNQSTHPILKIQEVINKPIENIIEFKVDDSPNTIQKLVHWNDSTQDITTLLSEISTLKQTVENITAELLTLKTGLHNEIQEEFSKGFLELRNLCNTITLPNHIIQNKPIDS